MSVREEDVRKAMARSNMRESSMLPPPRHHHFFNSPSPVPTPSASPSPSCEDSDLLPLSSSVLNEERWIKEYSVSMAILQYMMLERLSHEPSLSSEPSSSNKAAQGAIVLALINLSILAISNSSPSVCSQLLELTLNKLAHMTPKETPSNKISATLSQAMSNIYSPHRMLKTHRDYPIVPAQDVQRANEEVQATLAKANKYMIFHMAVQGGFTYTSGATSTMRSPTMRPSSPPVD